MTDLNRSVQRIRVALFLFGVPFVASVVGLGLGPALPQVSSVQPAVLEIIAAATAIGLLVSILMGWTNDRRTLRKQERELIEQAHELTLRRQELEAHQAQHALQFSLKEQQVEKELAMREEHIKVREMEHALALCEAEADPAGPEQSSVRPSPLSARREPTGLTRPRRVLADPESVEPPLALDSEQESVAVRDVVR